MQSCHVTERMMFMFKCATKFTHRLGINSNVIMGSGDRAVIHTVKRPTAVMGYIYFVTFPSGPVTDEVIAAYAQGRLIFRPDMINLSPETFDKTAWSYEATEYLTGMERPRIVDVTSQFWDSSLQSAVQFMSLLTSKKRLSPIPTVDHAINRSAVIDPDEEERRKQIAFFFGKRWSSGLK